MQAVQAVAGPSTVNASATVPPRAPAPLKVTDFRSQAAKKRAYFIQLCTKITVQGKLCDLCLANDTVTAEDVFYRHTGQEIHLHQRATCAFYTPRSKLSLYLHWKYETLKFPKAFHSYGNNAAADDNPVCAKPMHVCPFCKTRTKFNYRSIIDHIVKKHAEEIPAPLRDGFKLTLPVDEAMDPADMDGLLPLIDNPLVMLGRLLGEVRLEEPSFHPNFHPSLQPEFDPNFEPTFNEPTFKARFDPYLDTSFKPLYEPDSQVTYRPSQPPTFTTDFSPTMDCSDFERDNAQMYKMHLDKFVDSESENSESP